MEPAGLTSSSPLNWNQCGPNLRMGDGVWVGNSLSTGQAQSDVPVRSWLATRWVESVV